ncbi:c-type cytochrome [Hyphococcus sp.]|uniref:c-type cytochrome n=1 Tax=Hyphococcus sp. TaxID=2038636 RepID=UPI003CCB9638
MIAQFKVFTASAALLALAACGGESGSSGSGDQESVVLPGGQTVGEVAEARHEAMENIGESFKIIRDQLKAETPDLAEIRAAAAFIEEKSGEVGDWFPPETSPELGVDTDALAAIWEQPDEFAAAVARFETAASGLNAAAQSGDTASIGAAVQEIGGACKNCHDSFREDD